MDNRRTAQLLVKAGFKKDYEARQNGKRYIRIYQKTIGKRVVEVQFWFDSGHRVCHSFHGCSTTVPTDFETEEEMFAAIEKESTRTDNKYCK